MRCHASQKESKGICTNRVGRVLTKEEMKDIHSLLDREVCRYKYRKECTHVIKR